MGQVSPENLLEIWQNGKSLEDAMWEFCDSDIRNVIPQSVQNAYREWRNSGINESYIDAIANECNSSVELDIYSQQVQSEIDDMLENVYKKINSGELIAFGFQYPIESNFPSPIPIHMWPPESEDIDKSAVNSNGLKYVNIRIIEHSSIVDIAEIGELKLSPIKKSKKPGRPSTQQQIKDAYEYLIERGEIDFNSDLKPQMERIRETIERMFKEVVIDKGFGEQAIRNAIGEDFNKIKLAQKQLHK